MVDICIYTKPEVLMHKQGKLPTDDDEAEEGAYFWHLRRRPKKLKVYDKIYFAIKGYIRGFFIINSIEEDDDVSINFDCSSWVDVDWLEYKKLKPFQGFKYMEEKNAK